MEPKGLLLPNIPPPKARVPGKYVGLEAAFLSWNPVDWRPSGFDALTVPQGHIDVWRIALSGPAVVTAPVSSAELCRAKKFQFEKDRLAFLAARAAQRLILARYTGSGAESVHYDIGRNGKPALSDRNGSTPPLAFSLTRLGTRFALLAIAGGGCLGVDGEVIRPSSDLKLVAESYFSPEEAGYLDRLDAALQFFALWTAKEALVKATGDGLSADLDSFTVMDATARPRLIAGRPPFTPERWWLHRFAPDDESIATLAIDQEVVGMRPFQFSHGA